MNKFIQNSEEEALLLEFNRRNDVALGRVYDLYHRELQYFTRQLYRETNIEADDVIHDIFLKIWGSKKIEFKGLVNIKAYMYVSIKNNYLDYVAHNRSVNKFNQSLKDNPDTFITEIVESETFSVVTNAINILPKETAEIFKLILDGWDVKDIVEKLNISKSSVYSKRNEAISILRDKISKNTLIILLLTNTL